MLERVLTVGVAIAVLVLYYGYRWRQASAAADAMEAEFVRTRAWHHALQHHGAWAHLHQVLASQGIQAVLGPASGGQ